MHTFSIDIFVIWYDPLDILDFSYIHLNNLPKLLFLAENSIGAILGLFVKIDSVIYISYVFATFQFF